MTPKEKKDFQIITLQFLTVASISVIITAIIVMILC
jgi:hypothetical protein